ncbi:helix-turn-helix domain-containing protein [Smaragdicoccus niigatensis]|uniref:helix-turn-helix domain-containing protein n=1 Tax=Smaragdicoccus niigatensis TaxID=359359 RepID=UPI001B7F7F54|nr:helix-turn-helix domain-containing protein [Smaragdicoccus niigatensis]
MSKTDWLTPQEAAEELRVNPTTVHAWIHSGRLPAMQVSPRVTRIDRRDLDALVASSYRR